MDWGGDGEINAMLDSLFAIAGENTVLAISMDKSQKISSEKWKRLSKQNIGKRRFEILRKN